MKHALQRLSGAASRLAGALISGAIRGYQLAVYPLLRLSAGPSCGCRFAPSCSHYAAEAVALRGPWTGTWLALGRLVRCHPWSAGGWDPVPARRPRCLRVT